MQELRVIGTENGALLVETHDGEHFRLPIDESLHSTLRQSSSQQGSTRRIAPREIQAHIRGGMSAQDVASITGVDLEYIQKYEGPVLAEREFVIESALSVPVNTAIDADPLTAATTFGSVIRGRLRDLSAVNERWASWKEQESGWVVKLSFTANSIDHDARWGFDPKKLALSPLNGEAVTLSQQGELNGSLIPRLRAVSIGERHVDATRFDSGAFTNEPDDRDTSPVGTAVMFTRGSSGAPDAARLAKSPPTNHSQTADLLEALRRRRGERESASFNPDDVAAVLPSAGIRLIDVHIDEIPATFEERPFDERAEASAARHETPPSIVTAHKPAQRKGRAAMPSWDEIVFGARSEEDPA